MGEADRWAELGIAPTADRSAIRRAYAARLKTVRPDADPQGFARLRTAYEAALADADSLSPAPVPTPVPTLMPEPTPVREPTPEPEPPVTLDTLTAAMVAACLRQGDLLAATDALVEARAEGSVSIGEGVRLADQIGWALVHDRQATLPVLLRAAAQLNEAGAAGPWSRTLQARLDAEQWFAALSREASSRWRWLGVAQVLAARVMLGRGTLRTLGSVGREPILRRRYGEYLVHASYVRDRFDPVRLQSVSHLLDKAAAKRPSPVLSFIGIMIIAGAAGSAVGETNGGTVVFWVTAALLCVLLTRRRWSPWLARFRKHSDKP